MRRLILALVFLLPQLAAAAASVEVLESFPSGTSLRLPDGQTYYLRLDYTLDGPMQLFVRPYLRGKPANAGSNPSLLYPRGNGEAFGWFFLMNPGDAVDEIRIESGHADGNRVLYSFPVDIVAVARGAVPVAAEPEWVTRLRAAQTAELNRPREEAPTTLIGTGLITLLLAAVPVLVIGSIAWPIRAVRRWRGGWRTAAMVPLALIGFVVLRIVGGVAMDPTSHNLWPFEMVMAGAVSCGAMLVLVVLRWFQGVKE